jgi:uncharacterized protein with PIN domain
MENDVTSLSFKPTAGSPVLTFKARFRFYAQLNDFLPHEKRQTDIVYHSAGTPSVKDAIESIGIPHPEVELIVVNGQPVDFSYHVQADDRVAVYPLFAAVDISPIIRLRDRLLSVPTFVLDVHLGALARLLRMLGFDAVYRNDSSDPEIINIGVTQKRIILTCDRKLLQAKVVTYGYCVRSRAPLIQAQEIVARFDLRDSIRPFTRCTVCNGLVAPVDKIRIVDQLQSGTARYYDEFIQCGTCGKVYWKGSHFQKITQTLAMIYKPATDFTTK